MDTIIYSVIYSELLGEGTTPVAWATTREDVNLRDMMSVALKSISLMSVEDTHDTGDIPRQGPRAIIDRKDAFAIIPYPDQESISIVYLFDYMKPGNDQEKITATLSMLATAGNRDRLFSLHEPMKQFLKYFSFEILKILVNPCIDDARPAITALLDTMLAKVNRLDATT